MCEVLQLNKAIISRNRCINRRTGSRIITNKVWNEFPAKCSIRQHHPKTNFICQQEPIKGNIEKEALVILHIYENFITTALPGSYV